MDEENFLINFEGAQKSIEWLGEYSKIIKRITGYQKDYNLEKIC